MLKESEQGVVREPRSGWKDDGNGFLAPNSSFRTDTGFITPEYAEFAESQRSRTDIVEFIKIKIRQRRRRSSS